jgi:hypothetical protein
LPPARYRISSNAPFRVSLDGLPIITIAVDQQVVPQAGQWLALTELDIAGQELTIEVSDAADGAVVADAIRVERIAPAGLCLD